MTTSRKSSTLKSWGTRAKERSSRYTGDDLIPEAATTTFAVTVEAPAESVWPWLVQMGQGRGGMYSYARLENLFGLHITNAETIHEKWQHLNVGDQVRVVPRGRLGMKDGYAFRVAVVEKPTALVLRQQPPEHPWDATWAFLVVAETPDRCRLLARSRSRRLPGTRGLAARVAERCMSPVIFLMTRKMLLGIRKRAERENASGTGRRNPASPVAGEPSACAACPEPPRDRRVS